MAEKTDKNSVARVMIVDDEEMILTSLRSLLELDTDYDVVTFQAPSEALEYLQNSGLDLVISDHEMPDMKGIAFLAKVKEIDPQITRIILTGYADKESAIKAINEVGLFQYVEKPWDNENLKLVIRNGLEKQKLMRELDRKVQEIEKAYLDFQGLNREILKAFA